MYEDIIKQEFKIICIARSEELEAEIMQIFSPVFKQNGEIPEKY